MNCCVRFGFTAGFVLVASRDDPVSFNTTVGGGVGCPITDRSLHLKLATYEF